MGEKWWWSTDLVKLLIYLYTSERTPERGWSGERKEEEGEGRFRLSVFLQKKNFYFLFVFLGVVGVRGGGGGVGVFRFGVCVVSKSGFYIDFAKMSKRGHIANR